MRRQSTFIGSIERKKYSQRTSLEPISFDWCCFVRFRDPHETPRTVNHISWDTDSVRKVAASYCNLEFQAATRQKIFDSYIWDLGMNQHSRFIVQWQKEINRRRFKMFYCFFFDRISVKTRHVFETNIAVGLYWVQSKRKSSTGRWLSQWSSLWVQKLRDKSRLFKNHKFVLQVYSTWEKEVLLLINH